MNAQYHRMAARLTLIGALAATVQLIWAPPALAKSVLDDGKMVLTNGVSTIEGTSGGGLATWSTIAGRETSIGLGISAHATVVALPDYTWQSYGVALGIHDRIELSYARQVLDTRHVGSALGLGAGYKLRQDVLGTKLRLIGDLVYGPTWLPQISVGAQFKHSLNRPLDLAVGAHSASGTDFTLSATKLLLGPSILVDGTLRLTKANQQGLLGFGSTTGVSGQGGRTLTFEGSIAYQISRRTVIGGEYRTKPSHLRFAREDDWKDVFVTHALTRNLTVTAAYVDLGSIATYQNQRGGMLSAQLGF